MPIITPAYPSMCATHNISLSTKAVILRELQRGGDIVDKIFMKQLSWKDLFGRHTFFTHDYKYYLSITASSKTKEAESVWSGLVESKLRHLVGALDRKPIVAVAHPFPKGFERIHRITSEHEMEAVKNGSTQYQAKGTKTAMTDETKDAAHQAAIQNTLENAEVPEPAAGKVEGTVDSDGQTVYTTTYYIGLELKPLEPGNRTALPIRHDISNFFSLGQSRNLDISTDSQIFKSTCTSWPGYQEEVMELAVTHVRK
jgi:poly(A) polymerase